MYRYFLSLVLINYMAAGTLHYFREAKSKKWRKKSTKQF